jgi:spore germination protein PA
MNLIKGMFKMPAIVGAIKVNSVGTSSIVHIGDVITISPSSEVKTFAGAGSFNTGDGLNIYNQNSVTNTYDNDVIDQPIAGNL